MSKKQTPATLPVVRDRLFVDLEPETARRLAVYLESSGHKKTRVVNDALDLYLDAKDKEAEVLRKAKEAGKL